jgi:hypothetical protein
VKTGLDKAQQTSGFKGLDKIVTDFGLVTDSKGTYRKATKPFLIFIGRLGFIRTYLATVLG